jgi:hypothetical protein|tara:strand:+ start:604 stop:774 length:171 start_codon:yes stop_codon:yes gene_type:complete
MDPDKMLEELNSKEAELRNELLELEQQFNMKKEQYLKIQGALEALSMVGDSNKKEG